MMATPVVGVRVIVAVKVGVLTGLEVAVGEAPGRVWLGWKSALVVLWSLLKN